MININRLVEEFIELVNIDSLSFQERQMADRLKSKLQNMGVSVFEDDAGEKIGGNCGNIIADFKGRKAVKPIVIMAHMDTVTPGLGKDPIIKDGVIYSDGTTVLGSDNIAAIAIILEVLRVLDEEKVPHGDLQIVFTVAEEAMLLGSSNLDYSRIHASTGIVVDCSGDAGSVVLTSPAHNSIEVTIRGKAAHAGIEPKKGVSAIQIASKAISMMKLGEIDNETTANIGTIKGGNATNIVCDHVFIEAEARSRDQDKLHAQTMHMKECFDTATAFYGGAADFSYFRKYSGFNISEDDEIVKYLKAGAYEAGIEFKPIASCGGSDANILNEKGIKTVNLCIGMQSIHSVEENIAIVDMVKAAEFLLSCIILLNSG